MTSFFVLLLLVAVVGGALNRTHRRSARPWAALNPDGGLDRDWVCAKADLLALGASGIDRRPFRGPDRSDADATVAQPATQGKSDQRAVGRVSVDDTGAGHANAARHPTDGEVGPVTSDGDWTRAA